MNLLILTTSDRVQAGGAGRRLAVALFVEYHEELAAPAYSQRRRAKVNYVRLRSTWRAAMSPDRPSMPMPGCVPAPQR